MTRDDSIGAVVIGRNEGQRLVRCLASLTAQVSRLVYVDSGSSDGSVAVARAAGADVVELATDIPFTAARARNAGVERLRRDGNLPEFLFFIDGDCELAPDFLAVAGAFLHADTSAAVVCGRRRERFPAASIYNRLIDMEWNPPVGQARACGGDSLMRAAAFEAAGGFNGALIAGEEPELCFRLRQAGGTVWRLDTEMTRHDAAITRFGQWWRRAVRGGWAYAEGAALHGASPEGYNRRAVRSIVLWGSLVPAGALLMAAIAGWASALLVLAAAGGLYCAMMMRIALYRRRRFGDPWPDALAYGLFTMLGKIPQLLGVLRYHRSRRQGRSARIIEYKA
jgi:GT2 family glycosyltransferase